MLKLAYRAEHRNQVDLGPPKGKQAMIDTNNNQKIRQRVRIRFRKEGDLRLIGHRDLVRAVERSVRRAGVQMSMSEGFHPKARLSFPLALSVGIAGAAEVMEIDFSEVVEVESLTELLKGAFPPGLVIEGLELMPEGSKKAKVEQVVYEVTVPEDCRKSAEQAAIQLMGLPECMITRPGRKKPIDLRSTLVAIEFHEDQLRITQSTSATASAGPRDVLAQLGLSQLEEQGHFVTRTQLQLAAT